jgi:catechol 2,3-dioxygenase-like lactoylglutathione lyase family enzyme
MTRPALERMCPFFIVSNVAQSIAFYRDKLGFETCYQEPNDEPFFAVIGRDGAQLFLKAGEAAPLPNPTRDPAMRWDAYVLALDPDAIASEFADRGVAFSLPLMDTHDTLRGFEIKDPDGYVLFFGCPRDEAVHHKMQVQDN